MQHEPDYAQRPYSRHYEKQRERDEANADRDCDRLMEKMEKNK